jgi:hypothetical protein
MPQCHFSSIEMEKVHQFHSLAIPQRSEINSFRLIIQFELNWIYFDVFYFISLAKMAIISLRKNGSVDGAFFGVGTSPGVGSEKLKNRFRKSSAS